MVMLAVSTSKIDIADSGPVVTAVLPPVHSLPLCHTEARKRSSPGSMVIDELGWGTGIGAPVTEALPQLGHMTIEVGVKLTPPSTPGTPVTASIFTTCGPVGLPLL